MRIGWALGGEAFFRDRLIIVAWGSDRLRREPLIYAYGRIANGPIQCRGQQCRWRIDPVIMLLGAIRPGVKPVATKRGRV